MHSYNTRYMKQFNKEEKKIKSHIRFIDECDVNDVDSRYNLRSSPRSPRVNYFGFYRSYHEKFCKEIRRSPRISNMNDQKSNVNYVEL